MSEGCHTVNRQKKNASSILAGGDSYEYIKLKPPKPIFSDSFPVPRTTISASKEMHFCAKNHLY